MQSRRECVCKSDTAGGTLTATSSTQNSSIGIAQSAHRASTKAHGLIRPGIRSPSTDASPSQITTPRFPLALGYFFAKSPHQRVFVRDFSTGVQDPESSVISLATPASIGQGLGWRRHRSRPRRTFGPEAVVTRTAARHGRPR